MFLLPPRLSRTDTLLPDTTLFRSVQCVARARDDRAIETFRRQPAGHVLALPQEEHQQQRQIEQRIDAERPLGADRDHHQAADRRAEADRKSTRLNSSHYCASRMPYSA